MITQNISPVRSTRRPTLKQISRALVSKNVVMTPEVIELTKWASLTAAVFQERRTQNIAGAIANHIARAQMTSTRS
jgi:hypothetical protein